MQKETLVFKRMATKAKDGISGYLYTHSWGTGFQELIFSSPESARRFQHKLGTPEYIASLKRPA